MRVKKFFGLERSTTEAAQIFARIQEDMKVVRSMEEVDNEREERNNVAIVVDLKQHTQE